MAIAWTTVALLVFLLPGFVFSLGLLVPERFSRDTTPRSPFGQLAQIVLVSFFVHAGLILTTVGLARLVPSLPFPSLWLAFSALQAGGSGAATVFQLAENVGRFLPWIAVYVAISVVLGLALGASMATLAVNNRRGVLRFLLEHSWVYDLLPPRGNVIDLTYAYLFTRVTHNGKCLLYGGPLDRFGIRQDGTFSYFLLRRAERFCIDIAQAADRSSDRRPVISSPVDSGEVHHLFVPGDDVANVYFVRLALIKVPETAAEAIEAIDRESALPSVMIKCPKTGKELPTGLAMDAAAFGSATLANNSVRCPHCGETHTWNKSDAYLK